jgi:hypothetical protein
MRIQHHTFHLTQRVAVTERQRLGSIPHDAYVLDQPFQPGRPAEPQPLPTEKLEFDGGVPVYADNPVMDKVTGKIQSETQIRFVEAPPYRALSSGLSAAAGSVLGSVVAASLGSNPASLAVAGASAFAALAWGAVDGARDKVRVVDKEVPVFQSELVGYQHHVLEGVYAKDRSRPVTEGAGRLHYYLPDTRSHLVGTVTTQEIEHSGFAPQALAGISFLSGLASGLLLR